MNLFFASGQGMVGFLAILVVIPWVLLISAFVIAARDKEKKHTRASVALASVGFGCGVLWLIVAGIPKTSHVLDLAAFGLFPLGLIDLLFCITSQKKSTRAAGPGAS